MTRVFVLSISVALISPIPVHSSPWRNSDPFSITDDTIGVYSNNWPIARAPHAIKATDQGNSAYPKEMEGMPISFPRGNPSELTTARFPKPDLVATSIPNETWLSDYGGACDGSTDNSSAINSAIAALATAGGGELRLPSGVCQFGSALSIGSNGIWIEGSGQKATVLQPTFATGNAISLSGQYEKISNLTIAPSVTRTSGALVSITAHVATLEDLHLLNGYDGINIDNTGSQTAAKLARLVLEYQSNNGITLGANSTVPNLVNEVFVNDTTISGATNGIYDVYSDGVYANALSIYQGTISIKLIPGATNTISHHYFNELIADSASQSAILLYGSGVIGDIYFTNSAFNSNQSGFNIDSSMSKLFGLSIDHSTCENNSQRCMYVGNGQNINFDHSTIAYNSATGSASYPAIEIANSVGNNFHFTDNYCGAYGFLSNLGHTNNQSYCLTLDAGATDHMNISNNHLAGNAAGAISNNATGGHSIIEHNDGYNPIGSSAVTVGTSPFTFTAGPTTTSLNIWGGSVPQITSATGTVLCAPCGQTSFNLAPNESVIVTYSSIPYMSKWVH